MAEIIAKGVTMHCGDCLEMLATMPEASVDSCVTDPPYHLTSIVKRFGAEDAAPAQFGKDGAYARASAGFMGRKWDGGDIAFRPELWREVYRVLKPGAHLVAFGGTRTFHRMACAIEDAGFGIRDTIMYLYGSGFPKSHNVTKGAGNAICSCEKIPECDLRSVRNADVSEAVDAGDERGEVFASLSEQGASDAMLRAEPPQGRSGITQCGMERRRDLPSPPRQLCPSEIRSLSAGTNFDGAGGRLRDGASASDSPMDRPSIDPSGMRSPPGSSAIEQRAGEPRIMAVQPQPQKRGAWDHCGRCDKPVLPDGFGTALKPACEPIVLARKPLSEGTVAANVLRWGTGALNIDGCRVATDGESFKRPVAFGPDLHEGWSRPWQQNSEALAAFEARKQGAIEKAETLGRWPANVVHDGSDEVLAGFPDAEGGGNINGGRDPGYGGGWKTVAKPGMGDSGSAARFFYTAKADADDRLGSKHPTIKPIDLMQWLVRLVTPPGGLVLDPFAGTGTTGEAAFREGMRAVLIEREAEYQADIRRRMALILGGPDERARESLKASGKAQGHDDLPLFALPPRPTVGEPGYLDGSDFAGSIRDAFAAVKDRVAKGGKSWEPQ